MQLIWTWPRYYEESEFSRLAIVSNGYWKYTPLYSISKVRFKRFRLAREMSLKRYAESCFPKCKYVSHPTTSQPQTPRAMHLAGALRELGRVILLISPSTSPATSSALVTLVLLHNSNLLWTVPFHIALEASMIAVLARWSLRRLKALTLLWMW